MGQFTDGKPIPPAPPGGVPKGIQSSPPEGDGIQSQAWNDEGNRRSYECDPETRHMEDR